MEHSYRDSTFRAFVEGCLADLTGSWEGKLFHGKKGIVCPASQPCNEEEQDAGYGYSSFERKLHHNRSNVL